RIAGRQRREGGEAVRLCLNESGEPVVDARRDRGRVGTGELLRGRRAMGQHLDVDTGLVHLLETNLAGGEQPSGDARCTLRARAVRGQFLVPIVLLQCDDRTFRLLQHVFPPCWQGFVATVTGSVTTASP